MEPQKLTEDQKERLAFLLDQRHKIVVKHREAIRRKKYLITEIDEEKFFTQLK